MRRLLIACLGVLAVAACDEMADQPRYESYGKGDLFEDGKAMQSPPAGAVATAGPAAAPAIETPPPMTIALLERGRDRFAVYCSPCHGYAGYGHGTVPARGFPQPPSFHSQRLRAQPSAYFVDVISHGHGVMYSYADRVAWPDRWAIAAYIRALQLSQNTPVAALSPQERAALTKEAP